MYISSAALWEMENPDLAERAERNRLLDRDIANQQKVVDATANAARDMKVLSLDADRARMELGRTVSRQEVVDFYGRAHREWTVLRRLKRERGQW